MKSTLVIWLCHLVAKLPLRVLHGLGAVLGRLTYKFSRAYAKRMRENLGNALKGYSDAEFRKVLYAGIAEAGRGAIELIWIWCRPLGEVKASVRECHGWEHVENARSNGKGIVFLTPHLGCFDVSAIYAATFMPMIVLYRPPRLAWLDPLMRRGRERGQLRLARTDVSGVRLLYKALKRGEAIGLLPDQVPGNGEGEWVDFFGRPAYTMTLIGRLVQSSGAAVLLASVERLEKGAGYILRIIPLRLVDGAPISRQVNAALEELVLSNPAQYLWSYNRYKIPPGVRPAINQEKKSQ